MTGTITGSSLLKTAFLAVAGCAAVHIGFVAFGVEGLLHQAGHAVAGVLPGGGVSEAVAGVSGGAGCHFHGTELVCDLPS
jgi:hypothetical protein